jgi:hypothetical protein
MSLTFFVIASAIAICNAFPINMNRVARLSPLNAADFSSKATNRASWKPTFGGDGQHEIRMAVSFIVRPIYAFITIFQEYFQPIIFQLYPHRTSPIITVLIAIAMYLSLSYFLLFNSNFNFLKGP